MPPFELLHNEEEAAFLQCPCSNFSSMWEQIKRKCRDSSCWITTLSLLFCVLNQDIAWANAVTESDCEDRDFSARLGPVRNQTVSSWCWAFSAADLIGFYQNIDKQVSAVDIALSALTISSEGLGNAIAAVGSWEYYWNQVEDKDMPTLVNGATERMHRDFAGLRLQDRSSGTDEISAYNRRGRACLESEVSSQPPRAFREDKSTSPSPETISGNEMAFLDRKLEALGDHSVTAYFQPDRLLELLMTCPREEGLLEPQLGFFESFNQKVLANVDIAVQARCKVGPPVKPMQVQSESFDSTRKRRNKGEPPNAAETMARWLRAGTPMQIGYSADFLNDENWLPNTAHFPNHASVIVGMHWNKDTKSCDFKLRNSWGAECAGYALRFRGRCEGGNLWITESEANAITSRLTRIVPMP